jgi:hypothetical protein
MDLLIYIALGAIILGGLSIAGGYVIRKTARKQAGLPFYVSMMALLLMFGYGILPLLSLTGVAKAMAYGLAAGLSALASQYVFGEKIPQPPNSSADSNG